MNHQRTSFTPVPTHQEGATVSAFQFDRRVGHLQCWRRRGHTFNERRWNDFEGFLRKGGHCCNQLSGARRSQRWA
jgi:hypothetical protein